METKQGLQILKDAVILLRDAESEMHRPSEDAVTIAACNKAKHSMNKFMEYYLLNKSVPYKENENLVGLLHLCMQVDENFRKIDLSCVHCRLCSQEVQEEKYCIGVNNVNECVETANQIKTMVLGKLNISEKEID